MAKTQRLSPQDRELFSLTAQAVIANPFGEERDVLDRRIGDVPDNASDEETLQRAHAAVSGRVRALARQGEADVRLYTGDDAELMRLAQLFEIFHRYMDPFDFLILEQAGAGDKPVRVGFARDALSDLALAGFSPEEAERYFALFYQLRRAWYFIDGGLVGDSDSMRALRRHLWNNIFTVDSRWYERFLWDRLEDFSTLLLGETGTGKGAAAAAIGRSGFIPFDAGKSAFADSFTRNFVSINLSQFPESLIESELFGHCKGSFTGAVSDHQGVFARCRPYGAIFLDEIGDVSGPVQIKLLQVIQERSFTPVGSHDKQRFAGRVIAATNQPLDALRREGRFRDDFYYRMCSDVVGVPPLRRRLAEDPAELEVLLHHLLNRMTGERADELFDWVLSRLREAPGPGYPWPGNVRELEQAVRRVLLTGSYRGERTQTEEDGERALCDDMSMGTMDARELVARYCALLYRQHPTYEEVARRTGLDRRTVKKHILSVGEKNDR